MNWKLIKAFPKFVIVAGVFVLSTGLFGFWWMSRKAPQARAEAKPSTAPERQNDLPEPEPKVPPHVVAALPAKMGWLALVGSDLYDISTGELIIPNWIGGAPQ